MSTTPQAQAFFQEVVVALEAMEPQLLMDYREEVKDVELNEHEASAVFGATDSIQVFISSSKHSNNVSFAIDGNYADRWCRRDLDLSSTDYLDLVTDRNRVEAELMPLLQTWIDARVAATPTGGLYDFQVSVDFRTATSKSFVRTGVTSAPDPVRLGVWRDYLAPAIRAKSYRGWRNRELFSGRYHEALHLAGEVSTKRIIKFLKYYDKRISRLDRWSRELDFRGYFESLPDGHKLSAAEVDLVAALLFGDAYSSEELGTRNLKLGLRALAASGYDLPTPVVLDLPEAIRALDAALRQLSVEIAALPVPDDRFYRFRLPDRAMIRLDFSPGEPSVVKLLSGSWDEVTQVALPVDLSLLWDRNTWTDADSAHVAATLLDEVCAHGGRDVYPPIWDQEVRVSGAGWIEFDAFSEDAASYAEYRAELVAWIEAGDFSSLPLDPAQVGVAVLWDALAHVSPGLRAEFLSELMAQLKAAKVKLSGAWWRWGITLGFKWAARRDLGLLPVSVQDGWCELAWHYLQHGDSEQFAIARGVIKGLKRAGNALATELLSDYREWLDDDFWYSFDPDRLLSTKPNKPVLSEAVIRTKRKDHQIVLWLDEETPKAYGQAIEYLAKMMPKAVAAGAAADEQVRVIVKFSEPPLFPDVALYGSDGIEGKELTFAGLLGFKKSPELALLTKAAQYPELHAPLRKYALQALRAGWRYSDGSELDTALAAPAVIALMLADSAHLDLAGKYAAVCEEYEEAHLSLIPALKRRYGLNQDSVAAMLTLAATHQNGDEIISMDGDLVDYLETDGQ